MALPAPWGAYIANYSDFTKLYDYTGNNRHATISGRRPVLNTQPGYGATASIPSLFGSTRTQIIWPSGSIPTEFTICSITRYAGSAQQRILAGGGPSTAKNWLHGHHYRKSGVAFYNTWVTQYDGSSPDANSELTNWLVMCGTNNRILVHGVLQPLRATDGDGRNDTLTINALYTYPGDFIEQSDFGFQQVIIWNTKLSDTQMDTVSTLLTNYLTTGDITGYPWYSQANFSLIPRQSNYYKTTNSIQTSIYPTLELSPAIIQIVTDNSLNGVSNPYKSNDSYIFSSILDTSYTPDFTGINEKPNTVGYSVGGTDVSTWSIAPYVDINTFSTFSKEYIPSWCKAIRVIMIGGGGSKGEDSKNPDVYENNYTADWAEPVFGGQGVWNADNGARDKTNYDNYTANAINNRASFQAISEGGESQKQVVVHVKNCQNENDSQINQIDVETNLQQNQQNGNYYVQYQRKERIVGGTRVLTYRAQHKTGGLGGGGAAVYIGYISTETYSNIQISGTSSITLRLNNNNAIICNSGTNGGNATRDVNGNGGEGGKTQIITPGLVSPTFSADGNTGGKNGFNDKTKLDYGDSDRGPYYRVYFLTN